MSALPHIRVTAKVAVLTLAAACVSCGAGPRLHPVRGRVLFEGQPAGGATVVFQRTDGPATESLKPSGVVAADGSFTLSTYPHGKGAPAGEYMVLIAWYPPDARAAENPPNKLPDRYADPAQKLLRA